MSQHIDSTPDPKSHGSDQSEPASTSIRDNELDVMLRQRGQQANESAADFADLVMLRIADETSLTSMFNADNSTAKVVQAKPNRDSLLPVPAPSFASNPDSTLAKPTLPIPTLPTPSPTLLATELKTSESVAIVNLPEGDVNSLRRNCFSAKALGWSAVVTACVTGLTFAIWHFESTSNSHADANSIVDAGTKPQLPTMETADSGARQSNDQLAEATPQPKSAALPIDETRSGSLSMVLGGNADEDQNNETVVAKTTGGNDSAKQELLAVANPAQLITDAPDIAKSDASKPSIAPANAIANREHDWRISFQFSPDGFGSASINDFAMQQTILPPNLGPVLKTIGIETRRRFQYLQPRLERRLTGEIEIGQKRFEFLNDDEIHGAIDAALEYANKLEFNRPNMDKFLKRRAEFLSGFHQTSPFVNAFAGVASVSPQELDFEFAFATPDEIDFVKYAMRRTNKVLHDLAIERADWERTNEIEFSALPQRAMAAHQVTVKSINDVDFEQFVATGLLMMPPIEKVLPPMIQPMSHRELQLALKQFTPAFDLFRNLEEFTTAQRFVKSQQSVVDDKEMADLPPKIRRLRARLQQLSQRKKPNEKDKEEYADLFGRYTTLSKRYYELKNRPIQPLKSLLADRPDLHSLPLTMGNECIMEESNASSMDLVSKSVGATMGQFDRFGSRALSNNDSWRNSLVKQEIAKCCEMQNYKQALSTLDQVLQVDHPGLRVELVKALRSSKSNEGMKLIANRAKYDLTAAVRTFATEALTDYPIDEVRQEFIAGLKYPWAVVAMHSAEALVRMDDKAAVPELIEMLGEPNPRLPIESAPGKFHLRELVAINHMKNCLLCHAPSKYNWDYGRAVTPEFGQPPPQNYYQYGPSDRLAGKSSFVRADVTYLKQDFSVIQEVENHGPWPREQRFDYVVQNRPLHRKDAVIAAEKIMREENLNRKAVVFALEALTGRTTIRNSKAEWEAVAQQLEIENH